MAEMNSDDAVSRVMMTLVSSELQSYQSNLTFAVHVATQGWLPDLIDPATAKHKEMLREYLAANGAAEDDPFLLRLGLTAPGTQRGIVPPLLVLEPNRGGFSERRQREAAGHVKRVREALAIGRTFLPSLSPDTETAIGELAELSQLRSRPSDVQWLELFGQLSDDEADKLAARAMRCVESDAKSVRAIGARALQHLACFRQSPLSEAVCLALAEREVFDPARLYRDSGERPAEQLVESIGRAEDIAAVFGGLLALAWTRSDTAERSFRDWTENPPEWAKTLRLPPADYLPHAGWCLDENGQRRDLIPEQCFRLRPSSRRDATIRARIQLDELCPSCGSRLVHLFDFSLAGPVFAECGAVEAPTTILCCLNCSYGEPVYAKYAPDGSAEIVSTTEGTEPADASDTQPVTRHLTAVPCPAFAFAVRFTLEDASTLGGVPMWVQNPEYPRCIECGRFMSFHAQHDNGLLGEEGVHYAFYCDLCHVTAVTYQQT